MDAIQEPANQLLAAVSVLSAVVALLFWQLLKAKDALTEAYKEIVPITDQLLNAVQAIERITTRCGGPRK